MVKRKKNISGIKIKTAEDIKEMRVACETASAILQRLAKEVKIGKTTKEIDLFAAELMKEHQCQSAFLNYRGFPAYTCISINEVIVHGIGDDTVINDGDIVSLDVGIKKDGWIGDNALTVAVGGIDQESKRLLAVTEESLYQAIAYARNGVSLLDLCGSIEDYVKPFGFDIVQGFVGHGVGRDLHEEPSVPNYRAKGHFPKLRPGMVLAIEPMVTVGKGQFVILDDGWTAPTKDGKKAAHFEHTVLVTDGEPDILTKRPRTALPEQLGITL
jgi:methionyl aminopeptidase